MATSAAASPCSVFWFCVHQWSVDNRRHTSTTKVAHSDSQFQLLTAHLSVLTSKVMHILWFSAQKPTVGMGCLGGARPCSGERPLMDTAWDYDRKSAKDGSWGEELYRQQLNSPNRKAFTYGLEKGKRRAKAGVDKSPQVARIEDQSQWIMI